MAPSAPRLQPSCHATLVRPVTPEHHVKRAARNTQALQDTPGQPLAPPIQRARSSSPPTRRAPGGLPGRASHSSTSHSSQHPSSSPSQPTHHGLSAHHSVWGGQPNVSVSFRRVAVQGDGVLTPLTLWGIVPRTQGLWCLDVFTGRVDTCLCLFTLLIALFGEEHQSYASVHVVHAHPKRGPC